MKSRASIAGHPIHPMLIPIPLGGYLLTLIFDLVYLATGEAMWWEATRPVLLVAVIGALVASIPGLIDLVSTVPEGRPKIVGLTHMVLNLMVTTLFAANAWLRWSWPASVPVDPNTGLALSVIGVGLLGVAGWLGWTMVQSWHVGVLEPGEEGHTGDREFANPTTSPG
jgi:uncharacterized membrane protein